MSLVVPVCFAFVVVYLQNKRSLIPSDLIRDAISKPKAGEEREHAKMKITRETKSWARPAVDDD